MKVIPNFDIICMSDSKNQGFDVFALARKAQDPAYKVRIISLSQRRS